MRLTFVACATCMVATLIATPRDAAAQAAEIARFYTLHQFSVLLFPGNGIRTSYQLSMKKRDRIRVLETPSIPGAESAQALPLVLGLPNPRTP